MSEIVGLGEVLWDLLPTGKVLGGAPCNFVFHCHQLGHPALIASRVGRDPLGTEIRAALRDLGLSDELVQDDAEHPAGTVTVSLTAGQPSYTIHENVAWDHLALEERLAERVRSARAVCFGTLVQRHPAARATIQPLLAAARNSLTVYDVNLRQHYYSKETLETSLHASRWVKLNDAELLVLRDLLGLHGSGESALAADLRRQYGVELVALTRGDKGCLVQTASEEVDLPGIPVTVVDTVGAGDSFTAGLVCLTLEGRPLAEAAAFANRFAARVAARRGGTPRIRRSEIEE